MKVRREQLGSILLSDTTITVKSSGGDFTTIQGALDFLKDGFILGENVLIDVDPGTYSESLSFSNLVGKLKIRGDTRNLAAMTYLHGAEITHQEPVTEGAGSGICTMTDNANSLTILGSGNDPDFDGQTWDLWLLDQNGGVQEHNLAVGSGNSFVVGPPQALHAVSNEGSTVVLLPDRIIDATIRFRNPELELEIEGFRLVPASGRGVNLYDAYLKLSKVVVKDSSDEGIDVYENAWLVCKEQVTVVNCAMGILVRGNSFAHLGAEPGGVGGSNDSFSSFILNGDNIVVKEGSHVEAKKVKSGFGGTGILCDLNASVKAANCTNFGSSVGLYASNGGTVQATSASIKRKLALGDIGVKSENNGYVDVSNSTIDGGLDPSPANYTNGIIATDNSLVLANSCTVDGCQLGVKSSRASLVQVNSISFSGNDEDTSPSVVSEDGVSLVTTASGVLYQNIVDGYSVIQDALDSLISSVLKSVIIDFDAGDYNESLDLSKLTGEVVLRGDNRNIVGFSYVDNVTIQSDASGAGVGTCQLANSGSTITVTGSTTNPDFSTLGLVSGDKINVMDNSGVVTEREISSVSSNVITITTTAPTVGSNSSAVIILPNRKIQQKVFHDANKSLKVKFKGFILEDCVEVAESCVMLIENCVIKNITTIASCLICKNNATVEFEGKENSIIGSSDTTDSKAGVYVDDAYAKCDYVVAIKNFVNFFFDNNARGSVKFGGAYRSTGNDTTEPGVTAKRNSFIDVNSVNSRNNNLMGVRADKKSFILALNTSTLVTGNGAANFSPATSLTVGNNESMIEFT